MEKITKKCDYCHKEQSEHNFYKIVTEKLNRETGEYEPYTVCKDCLLYEYIYGGNVTEIKIHRMCLDYNLYYDTVISSNIILKKQKHRDTLIEYLRIISSLPQYIGKKYKDSVFEQEEKSDIDFINDDIKELKVKISKSLEKEDSNAHNKWMNSLRDAMELRDKLQGNKDCTINIGTIMVKDETDINKLSEELSKLAKINTISR